MTRRYSDQEARAIFEHALTAEHADGMSEEDLIQAAAEVGIPREAVVRAIGEVERAQAERDARRAVLGRRRRGLVNHLVPYVAVNLFLFVLNVLLTPGLWWFLMPVLGWGLGLFFHAWAALSTNVSERALRAELRRPEHRQNRSVQELFAREERERRRLRQQRLQQSTKALGEAVEEGVAAVLGKIATDLRDRTDQGREPRARVATDRVRVGDDAHEGEPDDPERATERKARR